MTKPLPTLWVGWRDVSATERRGHAYLADAPEMPTDTEYVPASSLTALAAENAALRALLAEVNDRIEDVRGCRCGPTSGCLAATAQAALQQKIAAALTPAKET